MVIDDIDVACPPLVPVRREIALGQLEGMFAVVDPVFPLYRYPFHLGSIQGIARFGRNQLLERIERFDHFVVLAG